MVEALSNLLFWVTICNPVLLSLCARRVDDELLLVLVVVGGGLHLDGVVAVGELGESEAADALEAIDRVEQLVVMLGAELEQRAAEQVELHGQLGGRRRIDHAGDFVSARIYVHAWIYITRRYGWKRWKTCVNDLRKNVARVVPEVLDGEQARVADALESIVSELTLLVKAHVVLGREQWL